MSTGEFFGYVASALVFATFYMRTMLPLRAAAIVSNVAFIVYASVEGLTPILILHSALLPLNVLRLVQLRELTAHIADAAQGAFSPQAILPLMKQRKLQAKERLFSANEPADELYYIVSGTVFLPEVQKEVGPGQFIGEFALFSDAGRRTATAIATTECTLMVLTKSAVFATLLQHPQLGIHLLKLITIRMLQNVGQYDPTLAPNEALAKPAETPHAGRVSPRFKRRAIRVGIAALCVVPIVLLAFQPLYIVLDRDSALTTWTNVATAPITGTVEGFDARAGQSVGRQREVMRILNHSADHAAVIRAEAAKRRADARLEQARSYRDRVARLEAEWTKRRALYADGFRRKLDLEIRDLEERLTLQKERVALAATSAQRRRSLRASGTGSQVDEETATSSYRELQVSLTEMEESLERVRLRRSLAGQGVYLQDDGKEPEWSWRSMDEIRLEMTRADRAVGDAEEEVRTATATLAQEKQNLARASLASIHVPAGMTIWSTATTDNASVRQGDPLFTWIDCSKLLVDVPVTETLAAMLQPGAPARVVLEGESVRRDATVLMARGAAARLGASELASLSRGHRAGSAQIVVALKDPESVSGCPIGRRAFVHFPEILPRHYLRAYLFGVNRDGTP